MYMYTPMYHQRHVRAQCSQGPPYSGAVGEVTSVFSRIGGDNQVRYQCVNFWYYWVVPNSSRVTGELVVPALSPPAAAV